MCTRGVTGTQEEVGLSLRQSGYGSLGEKYSINASQKMIANELLGAAQDTTDARY
jgi:hypothetical protein